MSVKNVPITKKTIMDIFRDIVIRFPLSKNNTINTFADAFTGEIFGEDSNGGFTYKEFQNGEFWSRDWVASGATQSSLKKEYPILAIESKNGQTTGSICKTPLQRCRNFTIIVGDLKECVGCPDEDFRTPSQVECDAEDMLFDAFAEFLTYAAYEETKTGKCVWLSRCRYEEIIKDNPRALKELPQSIESSIQDVPLKFVSWGSGYSHLRATSLTFTICGCSTEKKKFNCKPTTEKPDYDAVTVCGCC